MNFEAVKNKIEEWITPELELRNLFLVDVKFPIDRQIDIFIESDTGVHISECAVVSRFIEKNLDESGLVPDNYILNVSSPGMGNPLKVPRQYKRRVGQVLDVLKKDGTQIEAELVEADEEKIKLRATKIDEQKKGQKLKADELQEMNEYELKFDEIKRATLHF